MSVRDPYRDGVRDVEPRPECVVDDVADDRMIDSRARRKRRRQLRIQLFVDLHGRLICASLAFPDSWHDMHCFREAGWVDMIAHAGGGRGIGDLAYEGERKAVSTHVKKKPKKELVEFEKKINTILRKFESPSSGESVI